MWFRQLFDVESSTYTYLLADPRTRHAVLIDPVRERIERDSQLLEELGLVLRLCLETHVHADHVTGGGLLRERLGCELAVGRHAGVATADRLLADGDGVHFGDGRLEVRETPGHTAGCVSFVCHEEAMAFTGDALLIRGCGRTDFQEGDAGTLFRSVRERILTLPDQTRLYPAHDYHGRTVTTVAEEKRFNPRLGETRSQAEFVELMSGLRLAHPARMDEAVPANLASGVTEPEPAMASSRPEDAWAEGLRTPSGVPVVTPVWLEAHAEQVRVVDVREHIEFCGPLGHLEGARLVPMAALEGRVGEWSRERPLVTVCSYGTRSGRAAVWLEERGFTRVASLQGGMVRWHAEGRPAVEVLAGRAAQEAVLWQGMGI